MGFAILHTELLKKYASEIGDFTLEKLRQIKPIKKLVDYFSFYKSVSFVYSSKIEGEEIFEKTEKQVLSEKESLILAHQKSSYLKKILSVPDILALVNSATKKRIESLTICSDTQFVVPYEKKAMR